MPRSYDVVVVGAGPNGISAAIACAKAGLSVLVVEANDLPGGGTRTSEETMPGYLHDVCSTVHPLGLASPWLRTLGLEQHGLQWIHPDVPVAHVMPDSRALTLERSIEATALQLGRDGRMYRELMTPYVAEFPTLIEMILGPLRFPRAPRMFARFGLDALRSLRGLTRELFRGPEAPALLAGIAAHAMVPLDALATASFGLVLGMAAHAVGWPIARGGSRMITEAMLTVFRSHGGELELGHRVTSLDELPPAKAYLLDVTPRQMLAIAGDRLPAGYRHRLEKFRYGAGVFKIDWALREPVPWRDPACARSATVHLSGTIEHVALTERAVHAGKLAQRPFVLFVQPTLFDPSRAPAGKHIGWAYCHVPHGSTLDATQAIEDHIEVHAPGFREVIEARSTHTSVQLEQYNANYIGGDINSGISDIGQLLFRPMVKIDPYATPAKDIYMCSSSTPPGGGVHGMCGYWAARSALRNVFGLDVAPLATS